MATPNRKSILKVRFDVEKPESEVSGNENELSNIIPGRFRDTPSGEQPLDFNGLSAENGIVAPTPVKPNGMQDYVARPATPVSREPSVPLSPRSLRKSPSIRVVDAFGRERLSDNESTKNQVNGSAVGEDMSKTKIRIVDAMGRELPEVDNHLERPLTRGEALSHVQKGLADLANELDEEDRYFRLYA